MTLSGTVTASVQGSGRVGIWTASLDAVPPAAAGQIAAELEAQGWGTLWFGEAYGREAFTQAGLLLAATGRMRVATGIANIWARDAVAANAASRTLAAAHGGRFVLGLGVSHRPLVERVRGGSYTKPVAAMREYLTAMAGATFYAAEADEPRPPVLVAALGPRMLEVTRELADGSHPYLVTPAQTAAVRAALGPDKLVAVEMGAVLTSDRETALRRAHAHLDIYTGPAELPQQLAAGRLRRNGPRPRRLRQAGRSTHRVGRRSGDPQARTRASGRRGRPRLRPGPDGLPLRRTDRAVARARSRTRRRMTARADRRFGRGLDPGTETVGVLAGGGERQADEELAQSVALQDVEDTDPGPAVRQRFQVVAAFASRHAVLRHLGPPDLHRGFEGGDAELPGALHPGVLDGAPEDGALGRGGVRDPLDLEHPWAELRVVASVGEVGEHLFDGPIDLDRRFELS
jgi:probable F420-dependent oxidoreductase